MRLFWLTLRGCVLLGGSLLGLVECVDQPRPICITSPSGFATRLIEISREESDAGACDGLGPDSFYAADPVVSISSYYQRDADGQPDYERGSIGMQTAELGWLLAIAEWQGEQNQATDGESYSLGTYRSSEPDADDLCHVPSLTTARLVLPELPSVEDDPATEDDEEFEGQAPVDISLEWSKVRIYVTPRFYGTQFSAQLTDTRVTPEGSRCTIRYRAIGLAPAASCRVIGDSGDYVTDPDTGGYVVNPPACTPANDDRSFASSGVNPDARAICDEVSGFCLADGEAFPAVR